MKRERERLAKNQEELDAVRQDNEDMEQDMQRCRNKEKELLEFTQKLTETNVRLQSDLTAIQEKVIGSSIALFSGILFISTLYF